MHYLARQPYIVFPADSKGSVKKKSFLDLELHSIEISKLVGVKGFCPHLDVAYEKGYLICPHNQYCWSNTLYLCIFGFLLMEETKCMLALWNAYCPDTKALVTMLKDAWNTSHGIYQNNKFWGFDTHNPFLKEIRELLQFFSDKAHQSYWSQLYNLSLLHCEFISCSSIAS